MSLTLQSLFAADHLGAEEVAKAASSGAAYRRGTARSGVAAAGRRWAEIENSKGDPFLTAARNGQRQSAGREGYTIRLA